MYTTECLVTTFCLHLEKKESLKNIFLWRYLTSDDIDNRETFIFATGKKEKLFKIYTFF